MGWPLYVRISLATSGWLHVFWFRVSTGDRGNGVTKSIKGRRAVNKSELIDVVAASADISKVAATRAVDAMVESITGALQKSDQVTLVGFGTFSVKERAARTGRNPQTGEAIAIKAAKIPTFKAGKALKDAVQ